MGDKTVGFGRTGNFQLANGVTILDDITTYDYGKFVHIMDTDGSKIELWEP